MKKSKLLTLIMALMTTSTIFAQQDFPQVVDGNCKIRTQNEVSELNLTNFDPRRRFGMFAQGLSGNTRVYLTVNFNDNISIHINQNELSTFNLIPHKLGEEVEIDTHFHLNDRNSGVSCRLTIR